METTFKIDVADYLSEKEIKELVIEQAKCEIHKLFKDEKNAQRLLANLSYQIVFDEVDKTIADSRDIIAKKTIGIIEGGNFNYEVFRGREYGDSPSLAYVIMENTVKDNKQLINDKVKETITNRDYTEDVWKKFEELGETFVDNIYSIVELGRNKKS